MRKIKVRIIASNEEIFVRQTSPGHKYFIDDQNNPYTVEELDFTIEGEPTQEPFVQIARLFEMPKQDKMPSWDEMTEKSNASNLKFEKAKSELTQNEMLLAFKYDLVKILVSKGTDTNLKSLRDLMNIVDYLAEQIAKQ